MVEGYFRSECYATRDQIMLTYGTHIDVVTNEQYHYYAGNVELTLNQMRIDALRGGFLGTVYPIMGLNIPRNQIVRFSFFLCRPF